MDGLSRRNYMRTINAMGNEVESHTCVKRFSISDFSGHIGLNTQFHCPIPCFCIAKIRFHDRNLSHFGLKSSLIGMEIGSKAKCSLQ